ncbi:hypothetical protein HK101_002369, partial [Irineochytrium annulatum]
MAARPNDGGMLAMSLPQRNGRNSKASAASDGSRKMITPRSQVLVYEVQLKELFDAFPKSPAKERVRRCFQMLDEMIPFLGTFAPIVRIIKEELYRSCYSKNLTSCDVEPFVERIPYFCTVGRIDDARHEEITRANETLSEIQQKIKFRDHDLQMLYKKNMTLKQDINNLEGKNVAFQAKIATLEDTLQKNELEKSELKIYYQSKEDVLRREIEKLQTNVAQSNHIIEKLTVFKTSYNENAGDEGAEEEREKTKLELNINSMGMVEYDIYQSSRLQEQFAEILNLQLDDYEVSLSQLRKKKEILSGVLSSDGGEATYKLELHEIVASFRKRMTDLLEEQELLKTHMKSMKVIHTDYLSDTQTVERTADVALRKYATVMYVSSDNGQTFSPYKEAPYCGKCGERLDKFTKVRHKTVLCPHKNLHNTVVKLGMPITHVKFGRPSLSLRTIYKKEALDDAVADSEEENGEEKEDENLQTSKMMKLLWNEFYDRRGLAGGKKPKLTRPFQLQRLISLINEIYEARWNYEEERYTRAVERKEDEEIAMSKFNEFFYDFILNRYQIPEVTMKAIHDIFTALGQYEDESTTVAIFIKHLCSLEDVTWKYLYLCRMLITKYDNLTNLHKFRQLLGVLYPSRSREMYDQMELELIAFCKNRITKEIVEEHLQHMILENIEPNQKYFVAGLKKYDYQDNNFMSYDDFDDAMGQILPAAPTRLKRYRYRLAEIDTRREE